MEQLGKTPQDLAKNRQNVEQLRKQAEEMLSRATPEERRELERRAREWAQQNGMPDSPESPESQRQQAGRGEVGGGEGGDVPGLGDQPGEPQRSDAAEPPANWRTEPVDARRPADQRPDRAVNEQVVAEWLGPGGRSPADASSRESAAGRLDRAAARAERAMQDRTVSRRYDSILKRYFDRLPQRVLGELGEPGDGDQIAPSPAAPDANPQ